VPALVEAGYQVVLIDSRGHGRSTRDARPFMYELMVSDVLAVMDELHLDAADQVGWSDGACIALILAMSASARVASVIYFACNMDPSGAKQPFDETPALARCFHRHSEDYARLSSTPDQLVQLVEAVGLMQRTQPDVSAERLAEIRVPVLVVHTEHDEFIQREHAEYLGRSIPGAQLVVLRAVSHFAPLQRPRQFNATLNDFLNRTPTG
jgi:pimeloyl-ACP methyl ester carboxylesterase